MFADIVTEDIGDPVNGEVMTGLLAVFLEPDAVTTANKYSGGVESHDASVNFCRISIVIPGAVMTPTIRTEHVRVEVDTHFVLCPHRQTVDGFCFPIRQARGKKDVAGCQNTRRYRAQGRASRNGSFGRLDRHSLARPIDPLNAGIE